MAFITDSSEDIFVMIQRFFLFVFTDRECHNSNLYSLTAFGKEEEGAEEEQLSQGSLTLMHSFIIIIIPCY